MDSAIRCRGVLRAIPLLFAAWWGSPAPSLEAVVDDAAACAPPEPGFLTLDTAPWTVVYVDGVYAGSTPLFREKLAPGPHTLTLVNEGRALNTNEDVVIEEGKQKKLKLLLALDSDDVDTQLAIDSVAAAVVTADDCIVPEDEAASLSVDSLPWSKIYVDGKLIGSTPLWRHAITAGDHVVRLVRDDGEQSFVRFTAAVGETVKMSLTL
jgi:hypothetical protein